MVGRPGGARRGPGGNRQGAGSEEAEEARSRGRGPPAARVQEPPGGRQRPGQWGQRRHSAALRHGRDSLGRSSDALIGVLYDVHEAASGIPRVSEGRAQSGAPQRLGAMPGLPVGLL